MPHTKDRPGESVTLDRNSLLWRYLGDRRYILSMCRAVSLQMLHPTIASATHEFSQVKRRASSSRPTSTTSTRCA